MFFSWQHDFMVVGLLLWTQLRLQWIGATKSNEDHQALGPTIRSLLFTILLLLKWVTCFTFPQISHRLSVFNSIQYALEMSHLLMPWISCFNIWHYFTLQTCHKLAKSYACKHPHAYYILPTLNNIKGCRSHYTEWHFRDGFRVSRGASRIGDVS